MTEFSQPLPTIGDDYSLRFLVADDGTAVQDLCERCADYLQLITGLPPGPAEAQSLFVALPEGSSYDDKALIGVFVAPDVELIGVIDAVRDAPEPGEWWLGALLLDPAHRHHGLGTRLIHALETWVAALGGRAIYLSVVEQNTQALAFWRRLGFVEVERHQPQLFGVRESVAIVFRSLPLHAGRASDADLGHDAQHDAQHDTRHVS
jgi:GNAT superfamily N-acetyltransferase